MNFIVHDANGVILRTGECPDSMFASQARTGETVIEGVANDSLKYISSGVVQDKLTNTATLSGLTLSGLPVPATLTIEGVEYESTDGTAELSFAFPGTYQVKCEARHYLPRTFEATAT